jgi:hypothetical protein
LLTWARVKRRLAASQAWGATLPCPDELLLCGLVFTNQQNTKLPVEEKFMSLSAQIAQFQKERVGSMPAELRNTLMADTKRFWLVQVR